MENKNGEKDFDTGSKSRLALVMLTTLLVMCLLCAGIICYKVFTPDSVPIANDIIDNSVSDNDNWNFDGVYKKDEILFSFSFCDKMFKVTNSNSSILIDTEIWQDVKGDKFVKNFIRGAMMFQLPESATRIVSIEGKQEGMLVLRINGVYAKVDTDNASKIYFMGGNKVDLNKDLIFTLVYETAEGTNTLTSTFAFSQLTDYEIHI